MEIKLNQRNIVELVRNTDEFKSDINICSVNNKILVDAKSIMSVINLDLSSPLHIEIITSNKEEIKRFEETFRKYEVD